MEIRVAGAQIPVVGEIGENIAAIHRAIDFACGEGADILLTPEGSLSGYTHEFDAGKAGEGLEDVTGRASGAGLGLALGTCFVEEDGRCYNQIRFYEKDGRFLGFHSKTLTCGSLAEPPRGEIEHYTVSPLRTFEFAGARVGGLICNDLWANPGCTPGPDTHLTQQLAGMGGRILFHAVNGGRNGGEWSEVAWRYHEANLQMRAQAGRIWIVTVDNCFPDKWPCSSPSGVVGPDGRWVCRTGPQGEECFAQTIVWED